MMNKLLDGGHPIATNVEAMTSKGMREINYQEAQKFERATMQNNLLKPLLVLCGVSSRFLLNFKLIT